MLIKYLYDGESWTKTGDIPYIGDHTRVGAQYSIITKGTCTPVKDGLLFFNCPADGGGNVFLYHTDTGVSEPLYISFTDFKADRLSLYTAVETKDGVYYFEENGDRVMEMFNMYLLPADSGVYTPSYQDEQILGDADSDGKVTVLDSTYIQKYLTSIIQEDAINLITADAYKDTKITVLDATCIQKYLAHIPSNEHIGKPIE